MNRLLTIVDSKYQRLEYLESTGTQYIDTGYVPTENDVIECDVQNLTLEAGEKFFFGQRTLDSDKGDLWVEQATNNVWYVRFGSTSSVYANPTNQDKNNKIHLTLKKGSFISGGGTTLSPVWSGTMQSSSLTLFCRWDTAGTNAGFSKVRYWNFRITNNGVTKLNLVPVLRKTDNELGMLDLVEGKFYTNAGTGKFTANLDTMYAIIQGSPTVQDGIAYNFSEGNGLKLPALNYSTTNRVEININVIFTENGLQYRRIFGNANGIRIDTLGGSGKIRFRVNSDSNIIDTGYSINTKYNLKCIYQNGITECFVNGVSVGTISAEITANYPLGIGIAYSANTLNGSAPKSIINLNNSYIKLGSTKYKLQAVVGYTIVGSPTITDGVVSGFSSANYLTLPEMNTSSFEFVLKIKTPASFTSLEGLISEKTTTTYKSRIQFNAYGNISLLLSSNGTSFDIANTLSSLFLLVNTIYYIKFTFDGTKYVVSFSADGTSYETAITINSTTSLRQLPYIIGLNNGNNVAFTSSIDILNSYIKVNNKLWFNGQQA